MRSDDAAMATTGRGRAGRGLRAGVLAAAITAAGAVTCSGGSAAAQTPPPPPPPGAYPPGAYPAGAYPAGPYPVYVQRAPVLDWEPGEPVPAGYKPATKIRTGLVIGGAVTLGVVWILNVVVASFAVAGGGDGTRAAPLFAPVVGPFIAIGTLGVGSGGTIGGLAAFWLAFDGLVQSAGAAMLIAGIAAPKHVLVPIGTASTPTFTITPTPMRLGETGAGFGFRGTF